MFVEFECKMPTCSGPRLSKLEQGTSTETKKDVLLLDFPQNAGVRWNKNCPPPNTQYKGIYTWTSTPRALYQNRKLIRDNLNLQRWVESSRTWVFGQFKCLYSLFYYVAKRMLMCHSPLKKLAEQTSTSRL